MTQENEIMTDMLPIFNIPVLIIFNAGASYLDSFRKSLGLNCCDSNKELEVSILSGKTIKTNDTVKGVKLIMSE